MEDITFPSDDGRAGFDLRRRESIFGEDESDDGSGEYYYIPSNEPNRDLLRVADAMRQLVRNCRFYINERPAWPFVRVGDSIVAPPIDLQVEAPPGLMRGLPEATRQRVFAIFEEFRHYIQMGFSDAIVCREKAQSPGIMLDAISEAHSACGRELLRVAAHCVAEWWGMNDKEPPLSAIAFVDPVTLGDFGKLVGLEGKTLQNKLSELKGRKPLPKGNIGKKNSYSYAELRRWWLSKGNEPSISSLPALYADAIRLIQSKSVQLGD